jgi:hypothetical protein
MTLILSWQERGVNQLDRVNYLLQMQPCWWRDLAVHAIIGADPLTAELSLRMLQAVITYRQK